MKKMSPTETEMLATFKTALAPKVDEVLAEIIKTMSTLFRVVAEGEVDHCITVASACRRKTQTPEAKIWNEAVDTVVTALQAWKSASASSPR